MGKAQKSSAASMLIAGLLVIVVPLLYVLSTGPARRLKHQKLLDEKAYCAIYAPIDWSCERSPAWAKMLNDYATLWQP